MTDKKARGKGGARVLFVLAVLLIGSAALRLASGPAVAVAFDLADTLPTSADANADMAAPPAEDPFPKMAALLQTLRDKEAELAEKEALLDAKAKTLELLETRVRDGLLDLEVAEQKLAATMMRAQTAAEDDLVRLTAVYENMKPEQAADVFKQMEPSFAAGFLGRMRPDAAAAILAGLDADFAYAISVVLAGRNANVPTEDVTE